MYQIEFSTQFKKDFKACIKSGYDMSLIETAFGILRETGTLPVEKYKTHKLLGNLKGTWDAHIEPDWLLLWKNKNSDDPKFKGVISLVRTGTHSKLFKK